MAVGDENGGDRKATAVETASGQGSSRSWVWGPPIGTVAVQYMRTPGWTPEWLCRRRIGDDAVAAAAIDRSLPSPTTTTTIRGTEWARGPAVARRVWRLVTGRHLSLSSFPAVLELDPCFATRPVPNWTGTAWCRT